MTPLKRAVFYIVVLKFLALDYLNYERCKQIKITNNSLPSAILSF